MVGPQRLLADGEAALVQRLGLGSAALGAIKPGQPCNGRSELCVLLAMAPGLSVKEAAQKRVHGFEILPAPFVVAHLQIGLLLQNLGVSLDEAQGERVGVFLTNALSGWDENTAKPYLANWPELEAERKGAGKVKQETPILVVLGNPPYNAFAGVSPEAEQGLVETYKGIYWTQKKNKKGEVIATTYEMVGEITLTKVQKDKSMGEYTGSAQISEDWAVTDAAVDIEKLD